MNIDDFVDALDLSDQEKSLKMSFLKDLISLRTDYRGKIENYKNKIRDAQKKAP